jgi:hypothetical protein
MKTCLHLSKIGDEVSRFYQIVDESILVSENDIFDYSHYYNRLDYKTLKIFEAQDLKPGKYIVEAVTIDPENLADRVRYIYLREIEG